MYECFHCGTKSLIWQCDYSFEDFGYAGEGIVQILRCTNCGAEVGRDTPLSEGLYDVAIITNGEDR